MPRVLTAFLTFLGLLAALAGALAAILAVQFRLGATPAIAPHGTLDAVWTFFSLTYVGSAVWGGALYGLVRWEMRRAARPEAGPALAGGALGLAVGAFGGAVLFLFERDPPLALAWMGTAHGTAVLGALLGHAARRLEWALSSF